MSEFTFRPNPNVVATELDEAEAVLLDLKTRRYYSLNDTGTRIWQLLNEGQGVSSIAEAIAREWEVEAPEAGRYVQDFLDELTGEGLIEKVATAS